MLKISNLHVSLEDEDKQILKGVDLAVDAGAVIEPMVFLTTNNN